MGNGFYFDMTACIGCRTCQVACKDKNDLEMGVIFRRLSDFEVGEYPAVQTYHYSGSCNHCEKPECVAACPNAAMYIDEEDGTVQHDDEACIGCQTCVNSCPYGAPQFIEEDKIVQKCDTCRALREAGHEPVCVEACPMRAIEFGEMGDLRAAHPDAVSELPCTEPAATTTPNILIGASRGALLEDFNPVVL